VLQVNAIRGFLDSVARLTAQYKPNQVIACLDGDWRPSWRTELLPEYKAARDSANAEDEERAQEEIDLESQVPIILDILDAIGLPVIGIDDYEARRCYCDASNSRGPAKRDCNWRSRSISTRR